MDVFSIYQGKSPEVFLRLVGINIGTFKIILEKYKKELLIYKLEKTFRKNGRKSYLSIENQLLICFLYLRDYTTFIKLGILFGIISVNGSPLRSYAQKRFEFAKMILIRCLDVPDSSSLKTCLETNLIAIDVRARDRKTT